jgi:transposase, IS30 family
MKKKNYTHLSQMERDRIEALLNARHKQKEIAQILKRDGGTISREIERNRRKIKKKGGSINGRYQSSSAQHKTYARRKYAKYQGKKINENKELEEYIVIRLRKHWSPDSISGRMKKEKRKGFISFYASKNLIYEWLYSSWGQRYAEYLYTQRYKPKKRKRVQTKRVMIPNRLGIELRPKGATNRTRYRHFEGDTIVSGKKHHSKESVTIIYERKAKYIGLKKIKALKPKLLTRSIRAFKKNVKIRTLTLDNGLENREHQKLNIPTYFCDPYSAWQKGGVENAIKSVRRFIYKGSDIRQYSHQYVKMVMDKLNNKPRKSLGYKTPLEVMREHNLLTEINTNLLTKTNLEKIALGG